MSAWSQRPYPAWMVALYDDFVQSNLDVPFFLREAQQSGGNVLELTCGTGRISLPLVEMGVHLTGVDYSPEMIAALREKLTARGLAATLHCQDMRTLALGRQYDLVVIPFHAFGELTEPADQRQTLAAVRAHLKPGGRFICTLHNPPARLRRVDGRLQLWQDQPYPDDSGALLVWGSECYDEATRTITNLEIFERYDGAGLMQSRQMFRLQSALHDRASFTALASEAGFQPLTVYGDYTYAPFDEAHSPFMIWVLGI